MKDVCAQTQQVFSPSMASRIRHCIQIFPFNNMVVLQSIHLQKSEISCNLSFTILMTLQQSVVAERGRAPGGLRASYWEKGRRVLCCPTPYSRAIDIQELHLLLDAIRHQSGYQPPASEYPCGDSAVMLKKGAGRKVLFPPHRAEMIKSDFFTLSCHFLFLIVPWG